MIAAVAGEAPSPGGSSTAPSREPNLRAIRTGSAIGASGIALAVAPYAVVYGAFESGGRITFGTFIVLLYIGQIAASAAGILGVINVSRMAHPKTTALGVVASVASLVAPAVTVVVLGSSWWPFYLAFVPDGLVLGVHVAMFGPLLRIRSVLPSVALVGALVGAAGPLVVTYASLGSFEPEFALPGGFVVCAVGWVFDIVLLAWASAPRRPRSPALP